MKRVVMFSSGIGSWAAAKRVAQRHGTDDMVLLFTDTKIEDEDNYRFLDEAARNVGAPLVRIADGRTPWEVFRDERFLGNSRVDPCSRILKREMADRWLRENCDPSDTVAYVGIDWTEIHRFDNGRGGGLRPRRAADGWTYEAPMCERPYLSKRDMLRLLRAEGLEPPRLYALGYPHANCGGWCVKAGQGQFALLLRTMPERYAFHEAQEESMRTFLERDVSIMTDRSGDGKKKPLTMRAFRERIQIGAPVDMLDFGGCGCFLDEPAPSVGDEP